MKKIIYISLAAVLFNCLSQTSAYAQKGFRIGIVGGPQTSTLYNKDDFAKDNLIYEGKTTINKNVGLALGYNFSNKIGLGLDVRYSSQGQKYTQSILSVNYNFYQKNTLIKIPLMVTVNSNPDKSAMFVFKIGPQASLLTKAINETPVGNVDQSNYYSSLTYGAVLGLGGRFRIIDVLFFDAGLRVDADFTNAEDTSSPLHSPTRASTTNATAGLDLGLHLFIK